MMFPSSSHVAPRKLRASHNVVTAPPSTDIRRNFSPDEKPSHCPSGEKKGVCASSAPGMSERPGAIAISSTHRNRTS
jgi:hypothetical protein